MVGTITPVREAELPLIVRGPAGQEALIRAVIDTSFDGFLTLPNAQIVALGLTYYSRTVAMLADSSITSLRIFKATVVWDGQDRTVFVLAAEGGPLIGMALLYGNRLTADIIDGEASPSRRFLEISSDNDNAEEEQYGLGLRSHRQAASRRNRAIPPSRKLDAR